MLHPILALFANGRHVTKVAALVAIFLVLAAAVMAARRALRVRSKRAFALSGVTLCGVLALPSFINTACSAHYDDAFLATVCGGYVDPKAAEVTVRRLLAAGANPDAKGNTKECGGIGARPLHVALIFDRELVPLLLAAGANPNSRTNTSQTPLHYAALRGDLHACELLVAAGGDVNAVDRDGTSVLAIAVRGRDENVTTVDGIENHAPVIAFLKAKGATLEGRTWQRSFVARFALETWSQ